MLGLLGLGRLGKNRSLEAYDCAMVRHARTAEYALCATIGESARADNMASRLLAGQGIGDCESVEYVHGVWFVGVWLLLTGERLRWGSVGAQGVFAFILCRERRERLRRGVRGSCACKIFGARFLV